MKRSLILLCITAFAICSCSTEKPPAASSTDTTAAALETAHDVPDSITMDQAGKDAKMEIKAISTELGWGYDIYMNGSLYVHQPHIPAVSGNKGFNSEKDAKRTAELVVYKIKNNILPPSVTVKELDSLGVLK
jgi:hypothetical protein